MSHINHMNHKNPTKAISPTNRVSFEQAKETLDEIKQKDLPQIFQNKGIRLLPSGSDGYKCKCPFHEDQHPSLHMNRKNGVWLWNCFGCEASGAVIDFMMAYEHVDFKQAIRQLSPSAHSIVSSSEPTMDSVKKSTSKLSYLKDVVTYYHKVFKEKDLRGQKYLSQRGIASQEIIERFRVGFVDGSLSEKLGPDQEKIKTLKELGILNDKGHEVFYHCVVFAISDEQDQIVGLYGRHIERKSHLYLKGPHRGVFNKEAAKAYEEIILVESIIDALSLYKADIKNVIPLYGSQGLSPDHICLLQKYETKRIILLLDGDAAGQKASEAIAEKLYQQISSVESIKTVCLPQDLDPNAYLQEQTKEDLETLMAQATMFEKKAETHNINNAKDITNNIHVRKDEEHLTLTIKGSARSYRVRGLSPKASDRMRINLKVSQVADPENKELRYHIDSLDLYSHKMRHDYIRQARKTLLVDASQMEQELSQVLETLESIQKEVEKKAEKKNHLGAIETSTSMSQNDHDEALTFLKEDGLIDAIIKDVQTCGYVGEEMNILMAYLCATSRKISKPLAVMTISRSGAGKSTLQDAILSLMPPEDYLKYTRMTDQSLFYRGENELKHKCIAIEEEEGVSGSSYAVRNLLSAQGLSTSTTERDPETGKMTTKDYTVSGPTSMILATTSSSFDYETMNRFIILTINESSDQTKRILARQRESETLAGMMQYRAKAQIIRKHQNAQRLLRCLEVVNNYCPQLTFNHERLISRRGQGQYLSLIKTVALLRQHQKGIKHILHNGNNGSSFDYIEVDLKDIAIAHQIAHSTLGRSLDELPPPSRNLLNQIMDIKRKKEDDDEKEADMISRAEIRTWTGWGECQVRRHIQPLVDLGYLFASIGSRGKRYVYEVIYNGEGDEHENFMMGLVDVKTLIPPTLPTSSISQESEKLRHEKDNFVSKNTHFVSQNPNFVTTSSALRQS